MMNSKNRLQEFIQNIGYMPSNIFYEFPDKGYKVRLKIYLNQGITIIKEDKSENLAAAAVLKEIRDNYPALCVDWNIVKKEAQAGDALIKLAAYLTDELDSTANKSLWLQRVESDTNLETIFDRLFEEENPTVTMFGWNLGRKYKATWIEALIWREFTEKAVTPSLKKHLQKIYEFLEG